MKIIIFPTFSLLAILVSASLQAEYIPVVKEKNIDPTSLSSVETTDEVNQIPTTREMVYLLTQSAKMATDTADKVMKTYESYFTGISTAVTIALAVLAVFGGAGFWAYFKQILKLKKEHEGILNTIHEQQDKILDLEKKAHANISASSVACSANISINMFLYAKDAKAEALDESKAGSFLEEADKLCIRALEIDPKDPKVLSWVYGMQGVIFAEQGNLPKSSKAFLMALENDPDNIKTLCNATCSFALSGKIDEALKYLKHAVSLEPSVCEWAKSDDMLVEIRSDPDFPCS